MGGSFNIPNPIEEVLELTQKVTGPLLPGSQGPGSQAAKEAARIEKQIELDAQANAEELEKERRRRLRAYRSLFQTTPLGLQSDDVPTLGETANFGYWQ